MLKFVHPFSPANPVSEDERQRVSAQFKDLITDTLLNHAQDVRHTDLTSEDSILLRLKDPKEPNVEWSVSARCKTVTKPPSDEWESAEETQATINIQRSVGFSGREMFSYRLGSDGVVRRVDLGDMYAKVREQRAAGIGPRFLIGNETLEEMAQVAWPDPLRLVRSV